MTGAHRAPPQERKTAAKRVAQLVVGNLGHLDMAGLALLLANQADG